MQYKVHRATIASKRTAFYNIKVTVTPHKGLNSSRGVIRTKELADLSEEEIQYELSTQGVTAVKRIVIKRDGASITTNTLILTFDRSKPPSDIKAGYLIVRVDPYIPNPLRCYKCQKFGHGQNNCRNSEHMLPLWCQRPRRYYVHKHQSNAQIVRGPTWRLQKTALSGK